MIGVSADQASAAITQKLNEQIKHIKELCKLMKIKISGSDCRDKGTLLFYSTRSAVADALKF